MLTKLSRPFVLCLLALAVTGCEDFYPDLYGDDDDDDDDTEQTSVSSDADTGEDEDRGDPEPHESDRVPEDFDGVVWMHHNVSDWPETATLDASVSSGRVILDYDKADEWPGVQNVNASCWVFFIWDEVWHASTFDYLRPGQTTKGDGFYIPIDGTRYQPSSGEWVGFMVSGLARDHRRNVEERSNVDMVLWP